MWKIFIKKIEKRIAFSNSYINDWGWEKADVLSDN